MPKKVWNLEKDLCRCCHSEGSFKNMYTPYFWLDVEEVYCNMLRECLGIELIKVMEYSKMCAICEACIQRLRDAAEFKRQVQKCEIQFGKNYRNVNTSVPAMKKAKNESKMLIKVKRKVRSRRKHIVLLKDEIEIDYDNKDIGDYSNYKTNIDSTNKSVEDIDGYKNLLEGHNKKNIKEVGYSNKNTKDIGYSSKNTDDIGYSNKNTEDIGYSNKNTEDIGYSNKRMEEICYSNKYNKDITYSDKNIRAIGLGNKNKTEEISYGNEYVEEIGYSNKNMEDIGYSNKNMQDIGYSNKNMEDIGYITKRLKEIGNSDKRLEEIGNSDKRLEEISYSDNLLTNNNILSNNLNDANNFEYDSDAPISLLSKEYEENKDTVTNDNDKANLGALNKSISVICKAPQYKPVSERKRIRVTCQTVLRDTTACPFRHHRSWFRCFYCTDDFMDIDKLRQHTLETHTVEDIAALKLYPRTLQVDISELRCKLCGHHLTDVTAMADHMLTVHDKLVYKECIADYKVNTSPYTCHLCRKQYHVFRTLTTHLNEHYANCICDVCGKPFLNTKRLKVHKRTHESGTFPCTECGKVLKTKTSIANHMETHSKRILKCQICAKPMKHYNDRIKHMSEVHDITHKFKCVICGREYNIKHYLATHMRQAHGHKNKKCSECEMAFITNHGLRKHMLKHTGEKAFRCNICSKAYARSYSLKEHMRGHESEKVDQTT